MLRLLAICFIAFFATYGVLSFAQMQTGYPLRWMVGDTTPAFRAFSVQPCKEP